MAYPLRLLVVLFLIFIASFTSSSMAAPAGPRGFIIPVAKDTFPYGIILYSAAFGVGSKPSLSINFFVDLGGDLLWFICSSAQFNSSSYRKIMYTSLKCRLFNDPAMITTCFKNNTCVGPYCWLDTIHPYTSEKGGGVLSQDVMDFVSTPDGLRLGPRFISPQFLFACSNVKSISEPYSSSSLGMIGLSKNAFSLPNQLAPAFNLPRKFALCLPSKPKKYGYGDLFIGGGPYLYPPFIGDASRLFVTAPLFTNPLQSTMPSVSHPIYLKGCFMIKYAGTSNDYYIGVESLVVDGERVPFKKSLLKIQKDGSGGTQITTISFYTRMHPAIFKPFFSMFMAKAMEKKMAAVQADETWYPLKTCFQRESIRRREVPVIDLVLQSGGIWRIYGSNYLADYDANRTCLMIVDAEEVARAGIVIGSHVLEDTLMEFDLESSNFRVTSSLLRHNTSCSRFRTA